DPVLVEEIDDVDAEPLQRCFRHCADMLGTAVGSGGAGSLCLIADGEAELGGDDHPVAEGLQPLADEDLVGEGAINLRRVEEVDAKLHGTVQGADRVRLLLTAIAVAHPHAAEADGGNGKMWSKLSRLH